MKRTAYILAIIAVTVSLCPDSSGETMEERKQRIMRKYMRERQEVIQSEYELPLAGEENQQILNSEQFQQNNMNLSRKKSTVTPPVQMVRPVPAQARNSWLLNEEESDFDPNADPFALDSGGDAQTEGSDWLAEWRERQKERAANREVEPSRSYDYTGGRTTYSGGQSGSGYSSQQRWSSGYNTYDSSSRRDYYAQPSANQVGPYGYRTYSSSPSGLIQYPGSTTESANTDRSSASGYTPYKTPYQIREEQRRQQKSQQTQPQQEYLRPTPYQQWKDDNQQWDPTADDAYLDELMRRNRR